MSWITEEIVDGKKEKALNIVLPTKGCSYNKCYMCSYSLGITPKENLLEVVKNELENREVKKIKIFTSGSFLDSKEIRYEDQIEIFDYLSQKDIKEVTIETRPEFVDKENLKKLKNTLNKNLEIAIGLESANDYVLKYCINKGFTYNDFLDATEILSALEIKIKAYVFLKPLFLTEYESILDSVKTCEKIEEIVDSVSINSMAIHKKTLAEYFWQRGEYKLPWIWSLICVLNEIVDLDFHTICHPVALGKRRGIHNCGKCDRDLGKLIAEYSLKNKKIEYYHECKEEWEKILKREW